MLESPRCDAKAEHVPECSAFLFDFDVWLAGGGGEAVVAHDFGHGGGIGRGSGVGCGFEDPVPG